MRQTYTDPRGWRNAGVEFRAVRRGGDFSLVLSEASRVPSFASQCSSYYSCRVGRHVVINQDRWKSATSLHGCTHNPWPLRSELWLRR